MLTQIITKISEEFITEAMNSPNLLEDIASMEKYMSESYSGRIFVELLQNADDSGSHKIFLTEKYGHIIFANDGRCFNESDVIAISRSGASAKERGTTIGYRGIGFKSTTYLTNEIIIYSDDTYFTFSKSICSKALNKSENKIPTVRIPFLIQNLDGVLNDYISDLKDEGYTTVFILKNAKINEFIDELIDIDNGYFLFLNNINNCIIKVKNINKYFKIKRHMIETNQMISINGKKDENWLLVKNNKASIAFKYENNKIIPCDAEEAVFHCYLPTFDKVAFPIKVNSDFSTDPSRKHITADELTNNAIIIVSDLLFDIVRSIFTRTYNPVFSNILTILLRTNSFSRINSLLKERFKEKILSTKWIVLNNGTKISGKDYRTLPDWLEDAEKGIIRQKSKYVNDQSIDENIYKNILDIESFLTQYSSIKYTTEDFITILEDSKFASSVNPQTHSKILGV